MPNKHRTATYIITPVTLQKKPRNTKISRLLNGKFELNDTNEMCLKTEGFPNYNTLSEIILQIAETLAFLTNSNFTLPSPEK